MLGACGGESDKKQAEKVVRQYISALSSKDGETACRLLDDASREAAGSGCASAVENSDSSFSTNGGDLKVTRVEVDGDVAKVYVSGAPRPVPLVKEGGDWHIKVPPGGF